MTGAVLAGCATVDAHRALIVGGHACVGPKAYAEAAEANAETLRTLVWSPFGRAELGWEIYEPTIEAELHTRCPAETPGFAAPLAKWQGAHDLPATGAMDPASFEAMKLAWQGRRPFVAARALGLCPDPPLEARLVVAAPSERYRDKTVQLRRKAMRMYRRMAAGAKRALAEARADPEMLQLFSGYRSPDYDAARCTAEGNCDGITRAACSSHRTGLALDLVVGAAEGHTVDSSVDENRLYQSRTATYRWLVVNAKRFGFVNYVFEPWHWEWTGEAP